MKRQKEINYLLLIPCVFNHSDSVLTGLLERLRFDSGCFVYLNNQTVLVVFSILEPLKGTIIQSE